MTEGEKAFFYPHRGLREYARRFGAHRVQFVEELMCLRRFTGQFPARFADVGQAYRVDLDIANPGAAVTKIAQFVDLGCGQSGHDRTGFGTHQREHRKSIGLVFDLDPFVPLQMPAQPGQVAFDRAGTDIQAIAIAFELQRGQVAFVPAAFIQHCGVNRASRMAAHVVGANPVQESLRVGTGNADLAEAGLVENRSAAVGGIDFVSHLFEPFGFAETEFWFAPHVEKERAFPTVNLVEVSLVLLPCFV